VTVASQVALFTVDILSSLPFGTYTVSLPGTTAAL
jgi:hypothetical protein